MRPGCWQLCGSRCARERRRPRRHATRRPRATRRTRPCCSRSRLRSARSGTVRSASTWRRRRAIGRRRGCRRGDAGQASPRWSGRRSRRGGSGSPPAPSWPTAPRARRHDRSGWWVGCSTWIATGDRRRSSPRQSTTAAGASCRTSTGRGSLRRWPAVPRQLADDRQRLAAAVAATSRVHVLAGGPGTGKTTTVARLHRRARATSPAPLCGSHSRRPPARRPHASRRRSAPRWPS